MDVVVLTFFSIELGLLLVAIPARVEILDASERMEEGWRDFPVE